MSHLSSALQSTCPYNDVLTEAIDHLRDGSGFLVDQLRELTDEQLREQIAYYGQPRSNSYDSYRSSNLAHTAELVLAERNGGPAVEEWEADMQRQEQELGL